MSDKIAGLRTAIYTVSDISTAKLWYAKVFETQPYFDQPFYIGFDIGGFELGLQPGEAVNDKKESVVAYWGVKEIYKVYNKFIEAGATEYEKPTEVGEGIIVATLKDPWNNVIGLIFNPHFKLSRLIE